MGIVGTGFSLSLDGFVALPDDSIGPLFDWYNGGEIAIPFPGGMTVNVTLESAEQIREVHLRTGAIVTGRRLFDYTQGWGGRHPLDVPVFVVTHAIPTDWPHQDAPFTFVTDGVASAIARARAAAGERNVGVAGPNIAQQALRAGLIDEIAIDLVPVLLGAGVRFFEGLGPEPIALEPTRTVAAPGVTHLRCRVVK